MRVHPAILSITFGAVLGALTLTPSVAWAQNDAAIAAADADLAPVGTVDPAGTAGSSQRPSAPVAAPSGQPESGGQAAPAQAPATAGQPSTQDQAAAAAAGTSPSSQTYSQQDVLAKAENVFGKGAEGLAGLIQNIFKENGEPNGYIVGREAGGAIAVGLRYGSGSLFHKIEGERPVYWTGPSVGFDIGADASKVFALVYHLYNTEDMFARYPQVEGKVYFVGGFTATYLQRDDVIIVPIKLGVGWRLGANVGYMKFSKKSKILPF